MPGDELEPDVAVGGDELGVLLVVDERLGVLSCDDLAQLGAGEAGVEEQDVGAELGQPGRGDDEPAVVAAQHGDDVALADPAGAQAVGHGVGGGVDLAPRALAALVDDAGLVGVQRTRRGEAAGVVQAPVLGGRAGSQQATGAVGHDDPGTTHRARRDQQVVPIHRVIMPGLACPCCCVASPPTQRQMARALSRSTAPCRAPWWV
ncbi:MAG: hypothetical protein R2690_12760 [Acidimicrobiales bacterium]